MRSLNRTHDRQSFFKYMPSDTAKIVLANRTLRWSSPILFNDPFDVPREMLSGLTSTELFQALSRRITELIENPPEDTSQLKPKIRTIVDIAKNRILPKDRAKLLEGLKQIAASQRPPSEGMDALRAMWRISIPNFRILSLTESPDHIAMWYHYADKYQGVVMEFRCDDELDSAWLLAKPVDYPVLKPAIYTAEGWAMLLTMPQDLAIRTLLDASTFTKSPDWSYEREWRITSFKRPSDIGPFTDYPFHEMELAAVYMGPAISASDRESVTALTERFPSAVLWNVSIGMNRELHFNQQIG